MAYQDLNAFLKLLGLNTDNETPVNTDSAAQTGGGNGLLMGEAAINNINKRFWIGMGRYQAPIEISSVITLNTTGQTPNGDTVYNPGTLIINTVDNLAWIGTGGAGTDGGYISISGVTDLDGGTF
jgi:hypothetical protein